MNIGTILVVEDTLASLKLLTDILTAAGYRVLPANGGELALASVAVSRPDLILLDLRMPGMDGIEVLRRLKAKDETSGIPVMILSAVTETAERVEAYKLGAVDFVSKPFQREELLARVQVRLDLYLASELLHKQAADLRLAGEQLKFEITERRRIAEELRLAKEAAEDGLQQERLLMAAIVESSEDAIVGKSLEGIVTSWNRGAESMFGYPADEMLGQSIRKLIAPERQDEEEKLLATIRRGESIKHYDTERVRKDGSRIDVSITVSPIRDKGGRIVGASKIARDITERKQAEVEHVRLEAQLRESQKMEALGTLAGGVAHDFNNALAAIVGNVELARQDVGPDHPALVSLEEIGKASRRAKDLVQQILAFGRRQKLERKPTSLALVVVETARLVRAALPAMVDLRVHCEGNTPVVLADAAQVKQILLNLCVNSAQAVQDQAQSGAIEIVLDAYDHAQGKAQGDLRPGRYARLSVRDNGSGMDEATRSRIFEPFFTTKPAGKGTGLGLAVVHGIVQAHEGSIEVESAAGEGSTFRIYFPAVETSVADVVAPAADSAPVHGKGKHVLYLDDEEAIIFLMKRLLERRGYRVSGYTDPREALAAVRADPDQFDLAVTDYYMPGMSGLEVAQALRQIRPDLPVVMASGYITEELRAKAPAAGIRELIYKPNTIEDLCEAVARCANAQSGNARVS